MRHALPQRKYITRSIAQLTHDSYHFAPVSMPEGEALCGRLSEGQCLRTLLHLILFDSFEASEDILVNATLQFAPPINDACEAFPKSTLP